MVSVLLCQLKPALKVAEGFRMEFVHLGFRDRPISNREVDNVVHASPFRKRVSKRVASPDNPVTLTQARKSIFTGWSYSPKSNPPS
jgi:hypothetical protein